MAYETILSETTDGVLTLTLNRPDVLNAVTDAMLTELQDAFRGAERDASVRCIVLTGAGRGFCAGQDLNMRGEAADAPRPSVGDHLRHGYNPLVWRIRAIEKPVIAAVNGVAAKGGSLDGAGPVISGGMIFINSGYPRNGGMAGNVLLAFGIGDDK